MNVQGRNPSTAPGAAVQPRAELAGVQPAGARGSDQPRASAARAASLPVDFGHQPRRILHGPRRRPEGAPAPGRRGPQRRRHDRDPAARRDRRARRIRWSSRSRRNGCSSARRWPTRACQVVGEDDLADGRAWLARRPFPRADPAGADPAGDRPVAPVSVHSQRRFQPGFRPDARARRPSRSSNC